MANEAVLRNRMGAVPVDFIVADGTGIEKGTILQLTDPRTASASSTGGEIPAGVAMREKVANDGRTRLAVYPVGCGAIFDMTVTADTGAVTAGEKVVIDGANTVTRLAVSGLEPDDTKLVLGTALETGSASEVIQVKL
jgi:hypothetical protein